MYRARDLRSHPLAHLYFTTKKTQLVPFPIVLFPDKNDGLNSTACQRDDFCTYQIGPIVLKYYD